MTIFLEFSLKYDDGAPLKLGPGAKCPPLSTPAKKVTPLWGSLPGFVQLLLNRATKYFLILRSIYTTEVCLVLHESFVSKMRPKYNC